MCGIAGFIDRSKSQETLVEMTNALENRGPDDSGFFFDDGVGLGHRRLSIIDLSFSGHQPMSFEDLVLVFNGEIYNYREIQKELIGKNYSFDSSSDTEVVLKAFHCWGVDCVQRFIGMFAIAIYNKVSRELFLFRDRIGVKPLYYHLDGNRIAFASEIKGIERCLQGNKIGIDSLALSSFLSLGYINDDRSILSSVRRLPAGHYLRFANGVCQVEQYWLVNFSEDKSWDNRKEDDLLDELEYLIVDAFKYRMVSDVPVGVFLSAGIDSSLVAAVLTKHYGQIKSFTIGFNEPMYDESADAKRIATYLKTDHKEMFLTPELAFDILDRFYDIYDEPHGDTSCIPTTLVSRMAKANGVKVVLSADGGDELFGGYVRYVEFLARWRQVVQQPKLFRLIGKKAFTLGGYMLSGDIANRVSRFGDILGAEDFATFYQRMIRRTSASQLRSVFPGYIEPLRNDIDSKSLLSQMCEWDFKHYLTNNNLIKVDRSTMFNSIEGREPLLDHRLVEFAARLPDRYKINGEDTKYILKKLLGRYMPSALYDLPKRGFGAPLQEWIRKHYQERVVSVLSNPAPMFDRNAVLAMIDQTKQGRAMNETLLWYLFSFHLWLNKRNR